MSLATRPFGIQEYFVFDRSRAMLHAYGLTASAQYERRMPQAGRYASSVLGLELSVEDGKLRFSVGDAPVLSSDELLSKLGSLVNDAEQRAIELEAALEEEQKRREEAESEIVELRKELDRLRRE